MIFHVFHFQRLGQGPKEPASLRPNGVGIYLVFLARISMVSLFLSAVHYFLELY
jgi:hypothetical protein